MLRNNRGRPIVSVSIGAGSNGNADLLLTDLASVTGQSFFYHVYVVLVTGLQSIEIEIPYGVPSIFDTIAIAL